MKRIDTIVAAYPRVGAALPPEWEPLRGQLHSIGFTVCPADDPHRHWVISVGGGVDCDVPVLRLTRPVSIYRLKQAIIALFADRDG